MEAKDKNHGAAGDVGQPVEPPQKKKRSKRRRTDSRPGGQKSPQIDYTEQVRLADAGPQPEDLGHYLFALASELSRRWVKEDKLQGLLIILGVFRPDGRRSSKCRVQGMRQLGKNPLRERFLRADSPEFAELLYLGEGVFGDGAVVVDAGGQVLGSGAYLVVDHPEATVPDEGGSRHLAAASASMREDIHAAVTISEETGRVRLFAAGKVVAYFDPFEETKEKGGG